MVSANEIADVIGAHRPTREQADVIENAPVDSPAAVIAGAGSGKTELMSARVLWLVANRYMKPSEILGLTFTRKAARELQLRVGQRLNKLRETNLWPENLDQDYDPPKIATYNSFANEVFRSVALSIGYESDVPLVGEAGSYLLGRKFVDTLAYSLVPAIADRDRRSDSLVDLIISLEAEMGEHQVSAKKLEGYLAAMREHLSTLPRQEGGTDVTPYAYMAEITTPLVETIDIARLAEGYREFKRSSAAVDYSDQLRLAADALATDPTLASQIASQYRQILLDEYQDTSSVQVRLLSSLFHSKAVLAVGDPNQSIYGWRGAAAGTMENFGTNFGAKAESVFPLSSNWRSDRLILEVANRTAASLSSDATNRVAAPLVLTPRPDSGPGEVTVEFFEHELDEAEGVARLLAERITPTGTAAILFRKRKHMARYASALDAQNIRYEISGLGGLLQIPEVADLVAALQVVANPESGVSLMRLLAGPRWRIAPAEIAKLSDYAKKLGKLRHESGTALPTTMIEALDELAQPQPFAAPEFESDSLARLVEAAKLFRVLRQHVNLSLAEFVKAVVGELWLDVELMASGRSEPLSNLFSFYDLVADFESTTTDASLIGFLHWLSHAERKQRLEPPKTASKPGIVQLLTVHSSKGLEWDTVVVPDMVEGEFPSEERSYRGWLTAGKLPYPLRADAASLPDFEWESAQSQKSVKESLGQFKADVKEHLFSEQGRLAYVAFTRAKNSLILTGSHWATSGEVPRLPSRYLSFALEAIGSGSIDDIATQFEQNPKQGEPNQVSWPSRFGTEVDQVVVDLGQLVLSELNTPELLDIALVSQELSRRRSNLELELPTRFSATGLSSFLLDPKQFFADLARPLPAEYLESAEIGTAFHAALENALGFDQEPSVDLLAEFSTVGEAEALLVENFLRSNFANRKPIHVELPVQFVLGDLVVICKLDAVFQEEKGLQVVDWKTGSPQNLEKMRLQLSLYRLGLHKLTGERLDDITATLFFAKTGQTLSPENLYNESELLALIEAARKAHQVE